MIGDTVTRCLHRENAGVKSIGVSFGYHKNPSELVNAGLMK